MHKITLGPTQSVLYWKGHDVCFMHGMGRSVPAVDFVLWYFSAAAADDTTTIICRSSLRDVKSSCLVFEYYWCTLLLVRCVETFFQGHGLCLLDVFSINRRLSSW